MAKTAWREGKYVDLWSVVHVLSGVLGALIVGMLSVPFLTGLVVFLVLAVLWEYFEYKKKIWETGQNRITDVFLGVFVFIGSYYLLTKIPLSLEVYLILVVLIGGLLAILNIFGWRASD